MEKAETYRKLAKDCRNLASREFNIRQRVLLWMAVDAWTVLAEVTEGGEQNQSGEMSVDVPVLGELSSLRANLH